MGRTGSNAAYTIRGMHRSGREMISCTGERMENPKKEERKQRSNCDSSECIFLFFYKYPLKLMTIVKRTAIITGTVKSISGQGEVQR